MENTQLPSVTIQFTDEQKQVLKNTIAKDATDAELDFFIQVCMAHDLDPFKKEIFFAKSKSGRLDIITSRDGYLTIVHRDPKFIGLQSMEVYSNDKFTMDNDDGGEMKAHHSITSLDPNDRGDLLGAWATCRFKDRDDATVFVYLSEYKKMGHDNWTKYESAMVRKVAESIVLKRQGGISGLVTQEEIDITPDTAQLPPPKQVENTIGDIPKDPVSESEPRHSGPTDVTNQYQTETDDDGNTKPPEVIQTSEGSMFIEYQVGMHEVVRSVDTNEITCRTCQSGDCVHADKVKQFIGVE